MYIRMVGGKAVATVVRKEMLPQGATVALLAVTQLGTVHLCENEVNLYKYS